MPFLATGYVYPNDLHVHWSLMIVLYPYITGLVAGAFIVASLHKVFGVESLRPVASFALLFALAFLSCAALPLLVHLGHPGRALSMFLTPNPTSAMAGFGYLYTLYGVVLVLEVFFLYREHLVGRWLATTGWKSLGYRLLAMSSDNLSMEARALDARLLKFLAGLGIPLAILLHGYVGFIFGGIKANPLWASPLVPVVFIFSACSSGLAGVLLGYLVLGWIRDEKPDPSCVATCLRALGLVFLVTVSLEMLEIFFHAYMGTSTWPAIRALLWGPLWRSFWVLQVLVLSIVPLLLLGRVVLMRASARLVNALGVVTSALVLAQVLCMRWNTVIGGQMLSRSGVGMVEFHPRWLEREGILVSLALMVLPLIILGLLGRILPFGLRVATRVPVNKHAEDIPAHAVVGTVAGGRITPADRMETGPCGAVAPKSGGNP